jgi:putative membrane protein
VTPVDVDPRVTFAAERTVLAWIRTGLGLMGFGFLVARFGLMMAELGQVSERATASAASSEKAGMALVAAGLAVNVWASARHAVVMRRLSRGETIYPRARTPVVLGLATAVGGIALLALLASTFD